MLQAVFFAQMAAEEGHFDIDDSLDAINEEADPPPSARLRRRRRPKTSDDVKRRWDEIKADEKKAQGKPPKGLLARCPRALPALVEAQQIASRAAGAGFDWENIPSRCSTSCDEELARVRRSAPRHRLAARNRRRNRRLAVRPGQPGAVPQGGSRAGAAQNQRQVPPALRAHRRRHRGSGKTPGSDASRKWRRCGRKPSAEDDRDPRR